MLGGSKIISPSNAAVYWACGTPAARLAFTVGVAAPPIMRKPLAAAAARCCGRRIGRAFRIGVREEISQTHAWRQL